MSAYVPSEAEVEAAAEAMAPGLFGRRPDADVGPGTLYERNDTRRKARAALVAAHTVAPTTAANLGQIDQDAAMRMVLDLSDAERRIARARQWIETCVDPVAVGPARKAAMLAYLDGDDAVPDDLADLPSDVAPTPREDVAEWSESDRRDVRVWLIREADQRVKFFPQRRDGVDALMRHIATALLPAAARTAPTTEE